MFDNVENKPGYMAFFLNKAIEKIIENYYYEVTYDELYNAAIKGMTDILDEYSNYEKVVMNDVHPEDNRQNRNTVSHYKLSELIDNIAKNNYLNIRLIKIKEINNTTASELEYCIKCLKNEYVENVIIDLRDNMGGLVDAAIDVCNLLVSEGVLFRSYDRNMNTKIYKSSLIEKPFRKMVVITNGKTMSSAEAIAAALQDDGNLILGEKTYGKGVSQKSFNLYGNGILNITTKEYFRSNGECINKRGVIPNYCVDKTDNILKVAIKYF